MIYTTLYKDILHVHMHIPKLKKILSYESTFAADTESFILNLPAVPANAFKRAFTPQAQANLICETYHGWMK